MKKKKTIIILFGTMIAATLTGCGDKVSLTEEQYELIAEYAAGTMLKYSFDNEYNTSKLNTYKNTYKGSSSTQTTTSSAKGSSTATTSTTKAGSTTSAGGNSSGTATTTASSAKGGTASTTNAAAATTISQGFSNLLDISGLQFNCTNVSVTKSYPEGQYVIGMSAEDGKNLVVLEYEIVNNSGSDVTITTNNMNLSMKITANGSSYSNYSTIFKNDILNLYNVSISNGASYKAVAVFMVSSADSESADMVTSLSLLKSGSEIASGKLS